MPPNTVRIALLVATLASICSSFKAPISSSRACRYHQMRFHILMADKDSRENNEMDDTDEPRGKPSEDDTVDTEEVMYTFSQLKALSSSLSLSSKNLEGEGEISGAFTSGSAEHSATSAEIALERDLVSRPFSPLDLLVQRAIQTQLFYCNDLRNEPLAAWLQKFQDHSHLTGVPIRGSWHACLGLRLPAEDYLEALIRAEPYTFTVEFGIGVQSGGRSSSSNGAATDDADTSEQGTSVAEGNDADATVTKTDAESRSQGGGGGALELKTWGAAAASRRRNPYLTGQGRRTYEDTINPQQVASTIMNVCSHLVVEWSEDLALLAACDEEELAALTQPHKPLPSSSQLRSSSGPGSKKVASTDSSSGNDSAEVSNDNSIQSSSRSNSEEGRGLQSGADDSVAGTSFKAAGGRRPKSAGRTRARVDGVVRGWPPDSTPLRRLNYELLERAATLRALRYLILEVKEADNDLKGASSASSRATAAAVNKAQMEWAQRLFAEWTPILMGNGFALTPVQALESSNGNGANGNGNMEATVAANAASMPLAEAAVMHPTGGALLAALRLKPPVLASTSSGSKSGSDGKSASSSGSSVLAVDPPLMAQRILALRAEAARSLSEDLATSSADTLAQVRRSALKRAFTASAATESEATTAGKGADATQAPLSGPRPEDIDGGWSH